MTPFTNRTVTTGGVTIAFRDEGAGPVVVFSHGFPELAYSWRHQVPAMAGAGFRAIVPDQRGYGGSSRPSDVTAYDIHALTGDLVGILDALGIERAVFVGHDWGGVVAWMMPILHPTRTAGVIGVNTPYAPRPPMPLVALLRAMFGENHYVVHIQQPEVADAALARDVRRVFTQLMRRGVDGLAQLAAAEAPRNLVQIVGEGPGYGDPLLTDAELAVYVDAFTRTGFTGGLNWYRNMDRNWDTTPQHENATIDVPALMVTAEWDPVLRPEMADGMPEFIPDLETVMIRGCGHWTPQEKPAELNAIMVDWLTRRFADGR